MHKYAHTMLKDLTADQYTGIDNRYKVKHLVGWIKTSALETFKDTIWKNTTHRIDFEGTINLFKTFTTRKKTGLSGTNNSREESSTQHSGGGHGGLLYQGCGCGGGGGHGHQSFGGHECGGGRGYQ